MIYPSIFKSPNPFRPSLVWQSLYKLNRIGDKQHPCLSPLPIFTLLFSPQIICTLTPWAMYKLLISLLSCQSMKQTHSPMSVSKVHSDIILSIPIAFLVSFPLLNPNWSSIRCRSRQQVNCGQSQYLPQAVSAHPSHCFWIDASYHATYNTKNPCVYVCVYMQTCAGQGIL